jgi:glycosyltransferase involved in cell wall biosynthesis
MARTAVVIPAFNVEQFVRRSIESVQAQTQAVSEIVVVDDGSVDGTFGAASSTVDRVIRQTNSGPSSARNAGRRALSPNTDYVLFLDGDDVVAPRMIETLSGHLDRNPAAGVAYCRLRLIDASDRDLGGSGAWPPRIGPGRLGRPRLIPDHEPLTPLMSVLNLAALIPSVSLLRLRTFDQAGGWDERYRRGGAEDTALFVEMALLSEIRHVPQVLVSYRRHAAQQTGSAERERLREAQAELLARLRSRKEPELVRAWRIYDRQVTLEHLFAYGRAEIGAGHIFSAAKASMRAFSLILR